MSKNEDFTNGVWRTVGGKKIFIRDGEDLATAMKRSGKFSSAKKGNVKEDTESNKDSKEDYEYKLYQRAKLAPDSIDPMTENSTDWEALDKKYGSRFEKEQKESKTESTDKSTKAESKDGNPKLDEKELDNYAESLNDAFYTMMSGETMSGVDTNEALQKADNIFGKMNKDPEMRKQIDNYLKEKEYEFNVDDLEKDLPRNFKNFENIGGKGKDASQKTKGDLFTKDDYANNEKNNYIFWKDKGYELDSNGEKVTQKQYKDFSRAHSVGLVSDEDYNNKNYDALYSISKSTLSDAEKLDKEVRNLSYITTKDEDKAKSLNNIEKLYNKYKNNDSIYKKISKEKVEDILKGKEQKESDLDKSVSALNEIDKIAGNDERLQRVGRELGSNDFKAYTRAWNKYKLEHPGSKMDLYTFIQMNRKD